MDAQGARSAPNALQALQDKIPSSQPLRRSRPRRRFTEAAEAEDRARRGRRKVRARGDGADVAGRAGAGTGARAVPTGGRAGAESHAGPRVWHLTRGLRR